MENVQKPSRKIQFLLNRASQTLSRPSKNEEISTTHPKNIINPYEQSQLEEEEPAPSSNKNCCFQIIYWARQMRTKPVYHKIYFFLTVIYSLSLFITTPNPKDRITEISSLIEYIVQFCFLGTVLLRIISLDSIHLGWCSIEFISIVTGTACLFVTDMQWVRYLKAARCIRILLFIRITQSLYEPFNNFIRGFKNVNRIVIPTLTLIYIFSLIALFAFSGINFNRCRDPSNLDKLANWTYQESLNYLCGQKTCPIINGTQLECLNPLNYGVQPNHEEQNTLTMGYGLLNYNHIGYAIFNTFKMAFMTGWSRIVVLMKQGFNEPFTILYYLLFLFIIPHIYLNIFYGILISNQEHNNEKTEKISLIEINQSKEDNNRLYVDEGFMHRQTETSLQRDREKDSKVRDQLIQNILLAVTTKKNGSREKQKLKEINLNNNRELILVEEYKEEDFFKTEKKSTEDQIQMRGFDEDNQQIIRILPKDYYLPTNPQTRQRILKFIRYYQYFNNTMIVLCCVNICLYWEGEPQIRKIVRSWLDLFFLAQCTLDMIGKITIHIYKQVELETWAAKNKVMLQKNYNKMPPSLILQFVIVTLSLIGNIRQFLQNSSLNSLLFPTLASAKVLRCLKYSRIFILLSHQKISVQIQLSINCFIKALKKIKSYLMFYLLMVSIFTIIGFNLFHSESDVAKQISMNGVYEAYFFTFMSFYNQEWDIFMFMEYPSKGISIVIYQIIAAILGSLVLSKYFMALVMTHLNSQMETEQKKIDEIDANNLTGSNRISPLQTQIQTNQAEKIRLVIEADKADRISQTVSHQEQNQNQQSQSRLKLVLEKIKSFLLSKKYPIIYFLFTFFDVLDLVHRNPHEDPSSQRFQTWVMSERILVIIRVLDLGIWLIVMGIVRDHNSYLKIFKTNYGEMILTIFSFTSLIWPYNNVLFLIRKLKILRLFKLLEILSFHSNQMKLLIIGYGKLFPKLIRLLAIIFIIYGFFGCILVRLYGGDFRSCVNYPEHAEIINKWDCLSWGGDWIINPMNTDNFFNALLYTLMIASTEGWSNLMFQTSNLVGIDFQPIINANKHVRIFFIVFFFFGNMIVLNIFIGLSIQTIKKIERHQTGAENLGKHEEEWLLIKKRIDRIKLYKKIILQPGTFRFYCKTLMETKCYAYYRSFIILAYLIMISCLCALSDFFIRKTVVRATYIFIFISSINFTIETAGNEKLVKLQDKIFHTFFYLYAIILGVIQFGGLIEIQSDVSIILWNILICFLLFRYWLYIYELQYVKKIMRFISFILPRSFYTLIVMVVLLHVYIFIGMELFSYLKFNTELNEFDQNYTSYLKSLFALIKFATWEAPIDQIANASQQFAPNFICFQINSFQDFEKYGQNGCGNKVKSYLFFITFHILYSMILQTSLTANIYDSYCQVEKQEKIFQNQIQLQKFTKEWVDIDTQGSGYLLYNNFWRFVSRLHAIYNISLEKVLSVENKQKFLKKLDLPLHLKDGQLCFEFYETISQFSSLVLTHKYQKRISIKKTTCVFAKISEKEIKEEDGAEKTTKTIFRSEHVFSIILLRQGLRCWLKYSLGKQRANFYKEIIKKTKKGFPRFDEDAQQEEKEIQ